MEPIRFNIEASSLKARLRMVSVWEGAWPRSFGERSGRASHERKKKHNDSRRVLALAEGESPAPSFAEMPDSEAKSMSCMHRYATML